MLTCRNFLLCLEDRIVCRLQRISFDQVDHLDNHEENPTIEQIGQRNNREPITNRMPFTNFYKRKVFSTINTEESFRYLVRYIEYLPEAWQFLE